MDKTYRNGDNVTYLHPSGVRYARVIGGRSIVVVHNNGTKCAIDLIGVCGSCGAVLARQWDADNDNDAS